MALRWLRRIFEYESWANRRVLDALRGLPEKDEAAVGLLSHIMASQALWLNRIRGKPQEIAVWPDLSVDECSDLIDRMEERWREYLDALSEAELATEFSYTNTKGEPWTSAIGDTLTHLLLHNAYHRGQIAATLRRAGIDPPYTDYIHATRRNLI